MRVLFRSSWIFSQAAPPSCQNSPEVEIEVESSGHGPFPAAAAGSKRVSAYDVGDSREGEEKDGDYGFDYGGEDDRGANVEEIDTHCDEVWEDIQESTIMQEVRRIEQVIIGVWTADG